MPEAVRTTTSQPGRGLAEPRQRREAVEAGHREVEQDEVGLRLARARDRLLAVGRRARRRSKPCEREQRDERLAGQRMVVDDEDACCHAFLIGSDRSADKTPM